MTTTHPTLDSLAVVAVTLPGWRWMAGMLATAEGHKPLRLAVEEIPFVWWGSDGGKQDGAWCLQGDAVPDLTDPATAGCLLEMLGKGRPWEDRVCDVILLPQNMHSPATWSVRVARASRCYNGTHIHLAAACVLAAQARGGWTVAQTAGGATE
jgi:hypothetical protein